MKKVFQAHCKPGYFKTSKMSLNYLDICEGLSKEFLCAIFLDKRLGKGHFRIYWIRSRIFYGCRIPERSLALKITQCE